MSRSDGYQRNKLRTALEITQRIENWPTAFALRLWRHRPGLRLLNFRSGLNVVCRGNTRDWDVIHELLFAGSYKRAMEYLRGRTDTPLVLDLGGNIGLFSLLAAFSNPQAEVISFEPGPPNIRLWEINRLANPVLGERLQLRREAVGGSNRQTEWFFDEQNPGGSGLFSRGGQGYPVIITAFSDVIASVDKIALAKIDIEGAEYEILEATPAEVWQKVQAISLELHDDPSGKMTQTAFLERMRQLGFHVDSESVCSYFLYR